MKNVTKLLSIAGLAAAGLFSTQAYAAQICTGCAYTGNTFLGTLNPATTDQSTFTHQLGTGAGGINDVWAFTINPAGASTINAIFNPAASINNFKVDLYSTKAPTNCAVANGASCVSLTLDLLLAAGSPTNTNSSNINPLNLAAGTYAFVVTGSYAASNFGNNYSGNLNTAPAPVPEPGSLALLSLALLGFGTMARRRGTS